MLKKRTTFWFTPLVVIFTLGCPKNNNTSPDYNQRISVCNGGITQAYGVELGVDVVKILEGQGGLTADASKKIEGLFLGLGNVSEENAVEAYKLYLSCIERELGTVQGTDTTSAP